MLADEGFFFLIFLPFYISGVWIIRFVFVSMMGL